MSQDPTFTQADFLLAESVCELLAKDLEIYFQTHGEELEREVAQRHFHKRAALQMVRLMLIDRAERMDNHGNKGDEVRT